MNEEEEKKEGISEPVELTGTRKRLKDRYPEITPADDLGWEEAYGRYMDESESEISRFKEVEGKMSELCRVYPEFAELVYDMVENKSPLRVAVAKVFSPDDLTPKAGDDDFAGYQQAYNDRQTSVKKREDQGREIDENERKSMAAIDTFCAEKGLSDPQKNDLLDLIDGHFTELLYKRISVEMLEGFLKQMSFDDAVADAGKTAEIRGRNAAIEARRAKEKKEKEGDGLPGGAGGGSVEQKPRSVRDFWNEGGTRTNYSEMLNKKK